MTLDRDVLHLCPFKNRQTHNCRSCVSHQCVCVCVSLDSQRTCSHLWRCTTRIASVRLCVFFLQRHFLKKRNLLLFPKFVSFVCFSQSQQTLQDNRRKRQQTNSPFDWKRLRQKKSALPTLQCEATQWLASRQKKKNTHKYTDNCTHTQLFPPFYWFKQI